MYRSLYVVALLLVARGSALAEPRCERAVGQSGVVVVAGHSRSVQGKASYGLEVAYDSRSGPTFGEALFVYGEPSHTLLLAHFNEAGVSKETPIFEKALAQVYGDARSFRHMLTLPYNPASLGDTRVAVYLRNNGEDWLLSDGRVNVRDFELSTAFSLRNDPAGGFIEKAQHCCSSRLCGKICTTCDGAYFTCDLINCEIECGWF